MSTRKKKKNKKRTRRRTAGASGNGQLEWRVEKIKFKMQITKKGDISNTGRAVRLVVSAPHGVQQGDELFLSYLGGEGDGCEGEGGDVESLVAVSAKERIEELQGKYGFHCRCEECEEGREVLL